VVKGNTALLLSHNAMKFCQTNMHFMQIVGLNLTDWRLKWKEKRIQVMLINLNPRNLSFFLWQNPSHALLPLKSELSAACLKQVRTGQRPASWIRQMYVPSEIVVYFFQNVKSFIKPQQCHCSGFCVIYFICGFYAIVKTI